MNECEYCGGDADGVHKIITRADGLAIPCSGGDVKALRKQLADAVLLLSEVSHARGVAEGELRVVEARLAQVTRNAEQAWTEHLSTCFEAPVAQELATLTERAEKAEAILRNTGLGEELLDCTKTERKSAIDAFRQICALVEHDSPPYLVAVEALAWLVSSPTDEVTSLRAVRDAAADVDAAIETGDDNWARPTQDAPHYLRKLREALKACPR